jgi:HPt (histidine-containing phosphotransfer) domain-containing protein
MSGNEDAKAKAERQLREQVVALGVKFLQRTQDQTASLRELLEGLSKGDESVLPRMQELSHKIHGSGAMFGFEEVSRFAGEIEQLCYDRRQASEAGTSVPETADLLVQRLHDSIQALARATQNAQSQAARA